MNHYLILSRPLSSRQLVTSSGARGKEEDIDHQVSRTKRAAEKEIAVNQLRRAKRDAIKKLLAYQSPRAKREAKKKILVTNCLDHSERLRKICCFDQGSAFGHLSAKRDNHVLNEKEFSTNSADSHPISVWYRSTSTLISCPSIDIFCFLIKFKYRKIRCLISCLFTALKVLLMRRDRYFLIRRSSHFKHSLPQSLRKI